LEVVVDVVGYDEGVVLAGKVDELRAPLERHGFAGGVGEIGDGVDDVIVCFAPRPGGFEDLVSYQQ
jgi:hypothetical protein